MISEGKIDKIDSGRRFGKLTVISDTGKRINRYSIWRCKCDCGGEIDVSTRDLKYGKVRDCGCANHLRASIHDLTGMRFGKLCALYPIQRRNKNGGVIWHCRCDCGNEVDISSRKLQDSKYISCGKCDSGNHGLADKTKLAV